MGERGNITELQIVNHIMPLLSREEAEEMILERLKEGIIPGAKRYSPPHSERIIKRAKTMLKKIKTGDTRYIFPLHSERYELLKRMCTKVKEHGSLLRVMKAQEKLLKLQKSKIKGSLDIEEGEISEILKYLSQEKQHRVMYLYNKSIEK